MPTDAVQRLCSRVRRGMCLVLRCNRSTLDAFLVGSNDLTPARESLALARIPAFVGALLLSAAPSYGASRKLEVSLESSLSGNDGPLAS